MVFTDHGNAPVEVGLGSKGRYQWPGGQRVDQVAIGIEADPAVMASQDLQVGGMSEVSCR